LFVKQHDLGRVTGADGGYWVSGERYIPDVAVVSKARQPQPSHEAYNPNPPDLAVEVWSPGNKEDEMAIKIANYLAAGTRVWLFRPLERQVVVFLPGQPAKRLGIDGVLEGGDLLPGFSLKVSDIFGSSE
jgi:Uma2 family endonuclease